MLSAAETQYLLPFIGRSDVFAEQHDNGAWTPVRRHVMDEDIADHLAGRRTIGFYVVDPAGTVRSAILDIDAPKEMFERGEYGAAAKREQLEAARKLSESVHVLYGAAPLVEASGRKGLHVWIPYRRRVDARIARLGCERVLADAGFRLGPRNHWIADAFPAARVELFPKQDKLEQGEVGNLVKLPLGIHRVTGRESFLLDADFKRAEDPLPLLETIWR